MPNTFTLIASSTVGAGGASSIDFTSIPNTYTDLVVKVSARSTAASGAAAAYIVLNFNGTTGNKTFKRLYGLGSSTGTDSGTLALAGTTPAANVTANTFGNHEFYIPNYTSGNNKSVSIDAVSENNSSTDNELDLVAFLWSNSASITQVNLTLSQGNFAQYSTAYLYGVKNA